MKLLKVIPSIDIMHCCKDCREKFDKPIEYFNHRKREHPRYTCPDCGKVFGFRKKLVYHLRACPRSRKNKMRDESGSVISFSNYKRLPIFSAKELDAEFEIYMDRKFGKRGTFKNKKMCKFCYKTFTLASDFAHHIRDHYKSIPLDATGVKSKFDFMNFMGLKIRETTGTDYSDVDVLDKPEIKTRECRVVIVGERCQICSQLFKCRTDLEDHNKEHHSRVVMVVLRIGKELMARIPLKKRHLRSSSKSKKLEHSLKHEDRDRGTEDESPARESPEDNRNSEDRHLAESRIPSENEMASYEFGSSGQIYVDEYHDSIEFSEPWKEEITNGNTAWYSDLKLREGDPASDEDCYYIDTMRPRLTPKERTAWEQEHYNNEGVPCLDLSFHESPPIYKYSCDTKYQADFSFPSEEKSYGFDVENNNNNNNEAYDYKGAIIVKEERDNLMLNRTRSIGYKCDDDHFGYEDLEPGKPVVDAMDNYQKVLIKEEVMIDDCTYYINDVYPSLSYCV